MAGKDGFGKRAGACVLAAGIGLVLVPGRSVAADPPSSRDAGPAASQQLPTSQMLSDYYRQMSVPKPFTIRRGEEFAAHRRQLQQKVLEAAGLWPLPERVPLDVHQSPPLDHPWCSVRRVYYQLWPGVYSSGLLYVPKSMDERPAPAMLCPHGHWADGNAHPEVQRRCLNFARLGYVTFSSTQNHYEDLYVGVSHQTLMIWNNLRALDYLESLAEVDRRRIGAAGASGGGLQSQMVVGLDPRVKAATIVGLTCDFREIMFPDRCHCVCNHFPGVMRLTDHPEISALGLPAAVQYLTMNDWTRNFERDNFPTIKRLYEAAGVADRAECRYFNTEHSYDKAKREETYRFMERWVRGKAPAGPVAEPDDSKPFPVKTITALATPVPADKGFGQISRIYHEKRGYRAPAIATAAQWDAYRRQMVAELRKLLGEDAVLPRAASARHEPSANEEGPLLIHRLGYPSEGGILVPTIVVRRKAAEGKLPVVVICAAAGGKKALAEKGAGSPRQLAMDGSLVALPDVRCFASMASTGTGGDAALQQKAWERNGIVWGRPVPGMAATDLRGVLDGLSARPDADMTKVRMVGCDSGEAAIAVLFAAVLDGRVAVADLDFRGCSFEKRNLPLVSCVLQHGDVLQWAALLADRKLAIRNVPPEAGDPAWLRAAFAAKGNMAGLSMGAE
jgi:dienelactone hydrolase